mgnify:CR=1 FL=1
MKVGTKMIGNWGAMISQSYGIITKVSDADVYITWNDLDETSCPIIEINKGQGNGVGVGIYTEDNFMGVN